MLSKRGGCGEELVFTEEAFQVLAVEGGRPVGKWLHSWCPVFAVGVFHFSRMVWQQPGLAWEPGQGDLSVIQDREQ